MKEALKNNGWWLALVVAAGIVYASNTLPIPKPTPKPPTPATPVEKVSAKITDGGGNVPQTDIEVGDNLLLKSDKSIAAKIPGSVKWLVEPPTTAAKMSLLENGTAVSIPAGRKPTEIKVVLAVALHDEIATDAVTFKVTDPDAKPVPPTPQPQPQPFVPNPYVDPVRPVVPVVVETNVDKFKREIATLKMPTFTQSEVKGVIDAFRAVGKEVDAGTVTDVPDLLGHTSTMIQESVGQNVVIAWADWRTKMHEILARSMLTSFKDHGKFWAAVADVISQKTQSG